ncbi:MAG: response regulator, partial [Thermonemataceae bacterium]|nr:response regulator [Thermonemataceae bacterium]
MKKILIIEDEYPAAQKLSKMINDLGEDTQIVAVLDSVEAALAYLHQKPLLDLIFSDIQLSDGLSFSIFEQISPQAPIIFTTSYDEYALRAFKVASIDYLLKPIKKQELEQAYQKYKTFFEKKEGSDLYQQQLANLLREVGHKPKNELQRFLVKHQEQIIPIGTEQVAYFFTNNKMLCMVLKNAQQY